MAKEIAVQRPWRYRKEMGCGGDGDGGGWAIRRGMQKVLSVCLCVCWGGERDYSTHVLKNPCTAWWKLVWAQCSFRC